MTFVDQNGGLRWREWQRNHEREGLSGGEERERKIGEKKFQFFLMPCSGLANSNLYPTLILQIKISFFTYFESRSDI